MTMPVTTPMPKRDREDLQPEVEHAPVQRIAGEQTRIPSIVASQAARPMVKAGKMM